MSRRKKKSVLSFPIVNLSIPFDKIEANILETPINKFPAFDVLTGKFAQRNISKILCIGIGDLCCSASARLQLSFIIGIAKKLEISDLFYYDPVLCENCKPIVEKLGFQCGDKNLNGCYKFDHHSAFYLPHCPRFLYHNMISFNFNKEQLSELFIIGNSFANYEEQVKLFLQPKKTLVEDLYLTGAVNETSLNFLNNEVFDQISLMSIDSSKLPDTNDPFWTPQELMYQQNHEL